MERDTTPVLRWEYGRGDEVLRCELSLDGAHLLYEFRTQYRHVPSSVSRERFRDVAQAFDHQAAFEASLIEDGWSLTHFEKVRDAE